MSKSIAYPALYASALLARRKFQARRTLDEAVTFAQQFQWAGGRLRPVQARDEILWLLDLVQQLQPRRVLEIGTALGGTLFLWTQVAAPDALLVSIDMCPLGIFGEYSAFAVLCRGFARGRQRVELIFDRDSHRAETRDDAERLLRGAPVDFLFIDGDHSYEGVKRDFELYSALVRPGGLIALHDVAPRVAVETGVPPFWRELKQGRDTIERVAPTEPSYGIGVVRA